MASKKQLSIIMATIANPKYRMSGSSFAQQAERAQYSGMLHFMTPHHIQQGTVPNFHLSHTSLFLTHQGALNSTASNGCNTVSGRRDFHLEVSSHPHWFWLCRNYPNKVHTGLQFINVFNKWSFIHATVFGKCATTPTAKLQLEESI